MALLAYMLDPCLILASGGMWSLHWSSLVSCHPTGQAEVNPSCEPHQQSMAEEFLAKPRGEFCFQRKGVQKG